LFFAIIVFYFLIFRLCKTDIQLLAQESEAHFRLCHTFAGAKLQLFSDIRKKKVKKVKKVTQVLHMSEIICTFAAQFGTNTHNR